MAVFRADNETNGEPDADLEPDNNQLEEDAQSDALPAEPASVQAEKHQLDARRSDFNQGKINYQANQATTNERQALNRFKRTRNQPTPQQETSDKSRRYRSGNQPDNNFVSRLRSKFNKKVGLALGAFLLPTFIGLLLVLIALQAGFTLTHITRVTTGLRFGSMHLLLSRRFNHVRREYVRTAQYQTLGSNQFARYTKTTLGSRLLGVSPDKIYRHLNQKGYKFEYTTLRGGALTVKGRKTLTKVIEPGGQIRDIKSSADARQFLADIRYSFDDTEVSRFRATRASLLLAKQIGLPFLRFRSVIDGLRDGSLKNTIRGSPTNFVSQRINEEILDGKTRLARKLPRMQKSLANFGATDLVEQAQNGFAQEGLSRAQVTQNLQSHFDGRQKVLRVAAAGSVAVAVLTLACVVREIGTMIRDAFKMKVRGMQDSAATVLTTTSQIRAGDMQREVVDDLTQRFDGFATSATYQVGVQNRPVATVANVDGVDYSATLAPDSVFDGWAVQSFIKFGNLFSPASMLASITNYLQSDTNLIVGVVGQVADVLGAGLRLAVGQIESQIKQLCGNLLNAGVQIGIAIAEILITIVATIFSGGLAGGAKVGTGEVVKQVTKVMAGSIVAGVAGGIALDILLFDYLLPGMVNSAAGIDTALTVAQNNPSNGAKNYAAVDYGMQYLKEGEALGMGGSRVPVEQAVSQTQTYLKQQRDQYATQGWFNNTFSLNNPYSLATSLAVAQKTQGNWHQKTQSYLGNLLTNLAGIFSPQPVLAQSDETEQLANLLYPAQTTTISFHEAEMSGQVSDFTHTENTVYVEGDIERLQATYSPCLGIDVSEFLLTEVGGEVDEYGRSLYPEHCDDVEARRYKLYYQDCTLIDGLERWGNNTSPMFSSRCDHLLPQVKQDLLREPLHSEPAETAGDWSADTPATTTTAFTPASRIADRPTHVRALWQQPLAWRFD